jgi:hypothetical protein
MECVAWILSRFFLFFRLRYGCRLSSLPFGCRSGVLSAFTQEIVTPPLEHLVFAEFARDSAIVNCNMFGWGQPNILGSLVWFNNQPCTHASEVLLQFAADFGIQL